MKRCCFVAALLFCLFALSAADKPETGRKPIGKGPKVTGCALFGYACRDGLSCKLGAAAQKSMGQVYACTGSGKIKDGCPRGWKNKISLPGKIKTDKGNRAYVECEIPKSACTSAKGGVMRPSPLSSGHGYQCRNDLIYG